MESEIYKSVSEKFGKEVARSKDNLISKAEYVPIVEGLLEIVKPKKILEIGTFQGISAAFLSQFAEVITIDLRFQIMAKQVWRYLGVFQRIDYYVIPARKTIKKFIKNLDFDCAVLDADHTYKAVSNDYEMTKKCKNVIFHDYNLLGENNIFPDVTSFVNSLPEDEVTKSPPFALWRDKNGE